MNVIKSLCTLGILAAAGQASAAAIYSTSFDSPTFSAGNLDGQDGWVAQTEWQADGTGNVCTTSGAFIRAHNTGVLGSTNIGETMTLISDIILGAFTPPSTDIAPFEEGIFQQGMSHEQGTESFTYGLAAGLFYDVSSGNLVLRANEGTETGTSAVSLGAASGFGNSSFQLTTTYTKTAADTWAAAVSVTGAASASLSYTATGAADLNTDSDGGGTIGGFQALPSGGGSPGVSNPPFGVTKVTAYSVEVVPEPASLGLLGVGGMVLMARRRLA